IQTSNTWERPKVMPSNLPLLMAVKKTTTHTHTQTHTHTHTHTDTDTHTKQASLASHEEQKTRLMDSTNGQTENKTNGVSSQEIEFRLKKMGWKPQEMIAKSSVKKHSAFLCSCVMNFLPDRGALHTI